MLEVFMMAGAGIGAFIGAKVAYRIGRHVRWQINLMFEREAHNALRDAKVCTGCGGLIPGHDARYFEPGETARCGACGPLPKPAEPKAPAGG